MSESHAPASGPSTEELGSFTSYQRTVSLIKQYLHMVEVTPDGVRVRDSQVCIGLGTPSAPQIQAPIEIHPRQLAELLHVPVTLLDAILVACRETIGLTAKFAAELEIRLDEPGRNELRERAKTRIAGLETLSAALEAASSGHGPPYHPARLERCRYELEHHLGVGDPRIVVTYTVTRIL